MTRSNIELYVIRLLSCTRRSHESYVNIR